MSCGRTFSTGLTIWSTPGFRALKLSAAPASSLAAMNAIKEESRRSAGVHFLETVAQDLRFGLRVLRKSPGFTAVAILTLALGIGANTAIFSLIDTVMLRLLPVQKPQELMEVVRVNPARGGEPTSGFTNA